MIYFCTFIFVAELLSVGITVGRCEMARKNGTRTPDKSDIWLRLIIVIWTGILIYQNV